MWYVRDRCAQGLDAVMVDADDDRVRSRIEHEHACLCETDTPMEFFVCAHDGLLEFLCVEAAARSGYERVATLFFERGTHGLHTRIITGIFKNSSVDLAGMDVKAFNRWPVDGIHVADPGIAPYINLTARIVPKTGARYARNKFHKSHTFIVERFMNKIMNAGHKGKKHFISSGHMTGKANNAYTVMVEVLETIERRLERNPIEVLVKAIENAAPREEVISIEYGGARYPKAVECAPQRRIDVAIRAMTQGARQKSFNAKTSLVSALASEIIAAFENASESVAIAKKLETERQPDSSR